MRLADLLEPQTTTIHASSDDPIDRLLAMVADHPDAAAMLRTRMSGVPEAALQVVRMDDVRRVANKLNFALYPFASLSKDSYAREGAVMKRAIRGFTQVAADGGLVSYALAAPGHFDIVAYAASRPARPCFGGGSAAAFNGVHLMVPMLQAMGLQIEGLRADVTALAAKSAADFQTLSRGLQAVEGRVARVEATIKQTSQDAYRATEAAWLAVVAETPWKTVFQADPLLLAFDGDPRDAELALVGPCWGPPIEVAALRALQ